MEIIFIYLIYEKPLKSESHPWVLYGIVSWGDGCGNQFGVYSRVTSMVDWITQQTNIKSSKGIYFINLLDDLR